MANINKKLYNAYTYYFSNIVTERETERERERERERESFSVRCRFGEIKTGRSMGLVRHTVTTQSALYPLCTVGQPEIEENYHHRLE